MTDLTEEQEIELEMERQDAGMEQDLYDRMADVFDRAEKGTEMEAIWAVIEPAIAISELGGLRAKLADEAQRTREIESTCNRLLTSMLNLQAERDALRTQLAEVRKARTYSRSSMGRVYDYVRGSDLDRILDAPHSPADASSPVTAATEAHGETTEPQEG